VDTFAILKIEGKREEEDKARRSIPADAGMYRRHGDLQVPLGVFPLARGMNRLQPGKCAEVDRGGDMGRLPLPDFVVSGAAR
jgi:hypothetical protein